MAVTDLITGKPVWLDSIALDAASETPLYRQLYEAIRHAILNGALHPGVRLPSSRQLAADLGVGRNTVIGAFDQLVTEGYLTAHVGAGTVVAELPPDVLLNVGSPPGRKADDAAKPPAISARGLNMLETRRINPDDNLAAAPAFQPGLPATDQFPYEQWTKLLARRAREFKRPSLNYAFAAGHPALKAAIASYLGAARGVSCKPEQVIVTAGAQAGLDLSARLLSDPGDPIWIEEPGYMGARGAFLSAGAKLIPIPIDEEGMMADAAPATTPSPKLIYTTPSHQYPLSVTMSLNRRLSLLDRAASEGAWVLEDDYDSEYRYGGRPVAALQGLDGQERVIYMGTFSKVIFPSLRVGYLVVPEPLIDVFETAQRQTGQSASVIIQAALADFINDGHFASHIRRMRKLYQSRQELLLESLEAECGALLGVAPSPAGLQIPAFLRNDQDDIALSEAAQSKGVFAPPLSNLYLGNKKRKGFMLGYAGVPEAKIKMASRRLGQVLRDAGN